jgi:hypothetical protein
MVLEIAGEGDLFAIAGFISWGFGVFPYTLISVEFSSPSVRWLSLLLRYCNV